MPRFYVTLGRIAGAPLRVHWSVPPVLLAVVTLLGPLYGSGPAGYFWALLVALILWFSLVLHEAGHALVAQRCGLRVFRIVIYAPGGATEIDDAGITPGPEFLIAIAGPIVNLALAAACGIFWSIGEGGFERIAALHLAAANLAMALFNLLPGHPLDGGRALRAAIWFATGDELAAGRMQALVGRLSGAALLMIGVIYAVMTSDLLNAVWIGFLGFFLSGGATEGYRQVALRHTLRNVRVGDLMHSNYRAVPPELRLDEFAGSIAASRTEFGFPVVAHLDAEQPQLLGMITLRDLRRFAATQWPRTDVAQAMTPANRVVALTRETTASDALRLLLEHEADQLPVLAGDTLIGMLSRRDLASYIQMRATQSRG
jgi:Zn-dependent protease